MMRLQMGSLHLALMGGKLYIIDATGNTIAERNLANEDTVTFASALAYATEPFKRGGPQYEVDR